MNASERGKPRRRETGHPLILAIIVSFTAGAAALGGSVLGARLGRSPGPHRWSTSLFAGAAAGGVLGVALAVWLATCLGAIARTREQAWSAFIGGAVGFLLAIPIATHHLTGPLIPMASALMPGVGATLASLIAYRNSSRR
jgi:hypothetical protein